MYNERAYILGTTGCCIREIHGYGRQRAAIVGEENVIDYSQGNPSNPVAPAVVTALNELLQTADPLALHGYTAAIGAPETRTAIANGLSRRYGCTVTPGELFIGNGASGELAAVFLALATPGSQILAIAPYFPEYQPWVEQAGAAFRVVPPDMPDFQIRLDGVEAMLNPSTVALILNSPNNPAGTVYTEQTLRALGALLERKAEEFGHPIYIVSDEPYRELVYDGVTVPFLPAIYKNTIVCYSYSKSLSLPGERIGYIYVPAAAQDSQALYAAISGAARAYGHICAPSLWQQVIARCAEELPDMTQYSKNRRTLYEGLTALGYQVARPDGAFYLFVKAPGGDAEAFSKKAMARDLMIVPGGDFGCPEYFRLCYCISHEKILRSLTVFRELLEE